MTRRMTPVKHALTMAPRVSSSNVASHTDGYENAGLPRNRVETDEKRHTLANELYWNHLRAMLRGSST